MVTVNGAHLTRPRVFDAENAFSFDLVELFTSGRVEQNWLHTKERCGCRTRLRRGRTRKRCQHVTTSFGLPPCVNDRTCAFADNIVVPVPSFWVDRLTHGAEDAERRQVVFLNKLFAHAHQRTDRSRCGVELSNLVLFTHSPETASVWVGRNAFEHQGGAAVSERTVDDVRVASNPTHVSGTPVYVAFMVVEGVFVGHRCVDQITTSRVHNALWLTSRTRGVENEQRVFCVHRTCRALWRCVRHEVFHVNVTAINPSGLPLIILDGWGIAANPAVSAIDHGRTPFVDSLSAYPTSQLQASGRAVGLPDGQMGNSEVGHMNLGAGRIVYQDLVKIDLAIEERSLLQNTVFTDLLATAQGKKLHVLGLVSDGGVHSHIAHLKGLLSLFHEAGLDNVVLHAFTDGRDCDPQSGAGFLADVEAHMAQTTGRIGSITGRYFAMDRDKRWERVKKAYDALVHGNGQSWSGTAADDVKASYTAGVTDEFIEPIVLSDDRIQNGDVILFFNYRTDRGRELTQVLSQEAFPEHGMEPLTTHYYTLTNYDKTFQGVQAIFEKDHLRDTMGEVLERAGKRQIRIAETEKYPHVTFFFSGGREEPYEGEKRLLCPSPKVATYDLQPEMSAFDIRDAILPELEAESADFICLNFANPDMVGHTGSMEAAIIAVETVDQCTRAIVEKGLAHGYSFFILADHGNADCMKNPDGSPHTAHTTQPVPFHLVSPEGHHAATLADGVLGDVAPTILAWMGVEQPEAMTGKSLLG